jgi:hypothetical protein
MTAPDLSKANEKNAKLKLQLRADSGYSCSTDCRVSANQWSVICAVCENDAEARHLIAALEHIRMLDAAGNMAADLLAERKNGGAE